MRRTPKNENKKLVPLRKIAQASSYGFGYISILVQRKKLKAKKIGNKYYSTQEWFNEYLDLHARDSKKPKAAVEETTAGDLKTQINNLVEQVLIEKLDAKAAAPAEFVKWEDLAPASLPEFSAEPEEIISAAIASDAAQISSEDFSPAKENNLAEILDSNIKNSALEALQSGEVKFLADLEEPEIKMAGEWNNNFYQNEKELKSVIKLAAQKIKSAGKRISPVKLFSDRAERSLFLKIKKFSFLTLKTSAAALVLLLAAATSAQFAPQIIKNDSLQAIRINLSRALNFSSDKLLKLNPAATVGLSDFKGSLLDSVQEAKAAIAKVLQFNSAKDFQQNSARVLEARSIRAVAGVKIIASQSSLNWQFAITQARNIADNILPSRYLEPINQFKNNLLALAGLESFITKDFDGKVAGETEIAATDLAPLAQPAASTQTPAGASATSLASVQANKLINSTTRQMEILALVTDKQGKIADGEYDVRFALYNKNRTSADIYPSNTDQNNKVWEEVQKVTIKNGALRTFLGQNKNLPLLAMLDSDQYFLGIRIGSDSEMTPRKKLPAPFYAFNAMNASKLSGRTVGSRAGNIPALNSQGKNIGRLDYSLMPMEVTDFLARFIGGNLNQPSGATTTLASNVINIDFGGTGLNSYAKGDTLYYDSGKALSRLAVGTEGQVLTVLNGLPVWSNAKNQTIILGGGGGSSIRSTSDLPEGTNLYWTDARFDAKFNTSIAVIGVWTLNGLDAYRPTGNVGIGTSSPYAKLTVWGSGTGTNQLVNFVNSASTTLFTILENGNVGIGTSSPSDLLSLNGAMYFAPISAPAVTTDRLYNLGSNLYFGGALVGGATTGTWTLNGPDIYRPTGNVGIGTSSPYAKLTVWGSGDGTNQLVNFVNSASTSLLTILENGNIGIGTTSPGFNTLAIEKAGGTVSIYNTTNGSSVAMYLSSNQTDGTQKYGSVRFRADSDINGSLYFLINSVDYTDSKMTIQSGGNVGIGTTSPYSKLAIWGSGNLFELIDTSSSTKFKITDTGSTTIGLTTITPNASTNGQILISNGSDAYWQATSTLGLENSLGFTAPFSRLGNQISIAQASSTADGYLAAIDWQTFNNKISSTSLSAVWPLAYNSATGQITSATSSAVSAGVLSAADWLTFSNKWDLASSTIPVAKGGTGFSSYTPGDMLYASGPTTLAKIASTTNGYILSLGQGTGIPTWVA
ncbi:MAG: WD40 repeat domain-containing protein, partial [bacterium]|nr:WD40 repeat domain-containing protein [bacterium]